MLLHCESLAIGKSLLCYHYLFCFSPSCFTIIGDLQTVSFLIFLSLKPDNNNQIYD